jgi:hypothetical protein
MSPTKLIYASKFLLEVVKFEFQFFSNNVIWLDEQTNLIEHDFIKFQSDLHLNDLSLSFSSPLALLCVA